MREAAQYPVGSAQWWDDALADFRRNAPLHVREDLGQQFLKFKTDHADARDLDTSDKDPQGYVRAVQSQRLQQ